MRKGMICVSVVLWAWSATAAGFELELTVEEPAGVARTAAWVRGGVPLPKGRFRKGQPFALFADGAEVPAQIRPLVVDRDGGLRWVLVDLLADLDVNQKRTYTLKAVKPGARSERRLAVKDDAEGITIDTGRISFLVSRTQPFTLFTKVEAGGKPVVTGGEVGYTDATLPDPEKHRRYVAGRPEELTLEHAGPLRVTLKATGRFVGDDGSRLRYIARITAWAGRSDVHVKYSLANSNPEQYTYRRIGDSSIALKLAGAIAGTHLGADKPLAAGPTARLKQGLIVKWFRYGSVQSPKGAARAWDGDKEVWASESHKDHPLGWIAARTDRGTVFACDRFFWENPARELAVRDDALVLTGVTERFDGPVRVWYKGTKNEKRGRVGHPHRSKYRWLLDSNHLSSEYVLDFAVPAEAAVLVEAARAARRLPHLLAPPAWYFQTEALAAGRFGTQQDELTCYDTWGWKYDPNRAPKAPPLNHYHGTENSLLRWCKGTDNHYESEADVLEMILLMYLRTGCRPYFDFAQAWANHGTDTRIFRTDGWRFKDGGIWWTKGGPAGGGRPQRSADPVTGLRNYLPPKWSKGFANKKTGTKWDAADGRDIGFLADSRQCNCHNYAAGMAGWACITGDRDALDAAIDSVEMNHDYAVRHRAWTPGKTNRFSRDFTRACRAVNAVRLAAPADPFVIKSSDRITQTYLRRPQPEPRGFVNPPPAVQAPKRAVNVKKVLANLKKHAGENGMKAMEEAGVKVDPKTGCLVDPEGHKWHSLATPHTFMYPMLYRAIDTYHRITGDEDAGDWVIAIGKAFAQVAYQPHGNFAHYSNGLCDFPARGVFLDRVSWAIKGTDNKHGEGFGMSGYVARKWPDACARAYTLCGEPLLKQRAYDYWFAGSHRGYNAKKMHKLGAVGMWVNFYNCRDDHVGFNGHTFYIHSHPRADEKPPAAVTDLAVTVDGDRVTITFTAPADPGGSVARYQVKCSDRPLVSYERFRKHWADFTDGTVTNWWMGANLEGEPAPKKAGARERFVLTGVPEGAAYFAVRSYDDSSNRSAMSNVAEAK
jgi:hypothetical protein